MTVTTGLSGNEIYCLAKKNYIPGNIVVGNSIHSLGIIGSVGSGFKAMLGGELQQITSLIEEGRETAYKRMLQEAVTNNATGITGVTSQLIIHGANIEFLSIGSVIHADGSANKEKFSTSADGQELYAQLDAGYKPICFSFGNVAYSMGLGRGLLGGLKTLGRGEIKEYSDIFNKTRHLALNRIITHARMYNANAVLGIKTTVLPFGGVNEMLMIGTASHNPQLATDAANDVVTSDMTNIEMWNMANMGYAPMKLLLGTSVYSLGLVGGITSVLKSFFRGEINELTRMIYAARENALAIITEEAKAIGADDVVGVKTYVYQLGNGLVEFLAIGTAVKKSSRIKTESDQLLPQAIVVDKDTFYDSTHADTLSVDINRGAKPINRGSTSLLIPFLIIIFIIISFLLKIGH
ncbi:heavy metal-binding domain-containing protein [Legionella maioricensis]|uniref:Heavy metal-binding domain-containing protein n=1 Tax=Legionella maioricensis TaxID=2896528 RepID=A0A9X2D1X7_9GAMM|nr:heavy metal-binding domain-containing protein [Legionella maioricensis]MCL9685150.1 heavy metal-binding domain-containing protein [Legionella maioricensis]MCL9688337.1 heavy metal-binding domain-containing protein [Legionella maioricensis]